MKTLRSELSKVKAKVELEFAASRSEPRKCNEQLTRVARENPHVGTLFGCMFSGLRESMQVYYNRPENAADPWQDPQRIVREESGRQNLGPVMHLVSFKIKYIKLACYFSYVHLGKFLSVLRCSLAPSLFITLF